MRSFENGIIIQHGGLWPKKYYAKLITDKSYEETAHGKTTCEWYTDDIRAETSDIRKTYE